MLKQSIEDRLNDQIQIELQSAYVYYAMAAYFESTNLSGLANWMIVQAQEEIGHAHRIFDYVNDRGGRARLAAIDAPQESWDSPLAAIEDAYNHECAVSEKINECVALANSENDQMTHTFLQWFVSEQIEEEATADDLVHKLKRIGDDASGLFLLDNELGKRRAHGAAPE